MAQKEAAFSRQHSAVSQKEAFSENRKPLTTKDTKDTEKTKAYH